jgi:uncharacterized protein (DUF302 family)
MSETTTTSSSSTPYPAIRLVYDSAAGFEDTRTRFEERVPLLDPAVATEFVLSGASWDEVEEAVNGAVGPTGYVALARVDSGALLSLAGQPLEATLYLVGNPLLAREITAIQPLAALYAPFRVAVYRDPSGVHIAYDQPSSVLGSLASATVDEIALNLDDKIRRVTEEACR